MSPRHVLIGTAVGLPSALAVGDMANVTCQAHSRADQRLLRWFPAVEATVVCTWNLAIVALVLP